MMKFNKFIFLLPIFLFLISCSDQEDGLSDTDPIQTSKQIRILAFGNSYSQDAMDPYLYDLFKAEGIEAVIGNMYIAGCSLEKHWENISVAKNAAHFAVLNPFSVTDISE